MNNMFPINESEAVGVGDENDTPEQTDQQLAEETAPNEGEEENKGMDMGTEFKEDREQDLDDLVHSHRALKQTNIPPPEEA